MGLKLVTPPDEIGRVALAWTQSWPITRFSINSVVIQFVAGYGDAAQDVPHRDLEPV
jgi:hypothetical protein